MTKEDEIRGIETWKQVIDSLVRQEREMYQVMSMANCDEPTARQALSYFDKDMLIRLLSIGVSVSEVIQVAEALRDRYAG